MYIFPLYSTKIRGGSLLTKTNIIESETGLEQRTSSFSPKKSFTLTIEGIRTRGPINLAFDQVYRPTSTYFNLENFTKFFNDFAKGQLNCFTLKAWGEIVPADLTVRFTADEIELEYLSNYYVNMQITVVTAIC